MVMNDKVSLTVPLFIKLLEWAREEAPNDEALHSAAERAQAEMEEEEEEGEECLDMDDYELIVSARPEVYAHYSKESVQYTDNGTPSEHCAICEHYVGRNRCEIVLGSVMPSGWCNKWEEKS